MNGIKIVKFGEVNNSLQQDIIMDSTLETLPIEKQIPFRFTIFPQGTSSSTFGKGKYGTPHNLGYKPATLGWMKFYVNDDITKELRNKKLPCSQLRADGFWIYELMADNEFVYIEYNTTAASPDVAAFNVEGFFYLFEKDLSIV